MYTYSDWKESLSEGVVTYYFLFFCSGGGGGGDGGGGCDFVYWEKGGLYFLQAVLTANQLKVPFSTWVKTLLE